MPPLTAADILEALRQHHRPPQWAFLAELRVGTGYNLTRAEFNVERRIDAWVMNLWASQKFTRRAFEVKVSRSDFLAELKQPEKRREALALSNEYYFAAPQGLILVEELPHEAGLIEVTRVVNGALYEDIVRVIKKAPWRHCASPPTRFLAAVARRASEAESGRRVAR